LASSKTRKISGTHIQSGAGVDDARALRATQFYSPLEINTANNRLSRESCVHTCEVCENEYDKAFEIIMGGERHTFDSFERAIHALAPVCPHCTCRIVGHSVEARASGTTQLKDRVEEPVETLLLKRL